MQKKEEKKEKTDIEKSAKNRIDTGKKKSIIMDFVLRRITQGEKKNSSEGKKKRKEKTERLKTV